MAKMRRWLGHVPLRRIPKRPFGLAPPKSYMANMANPGVATAASPETVPHAPCQIVPDPSRDWLDPTQILLHEPGSAG